MEKFIKSLFSSEKKSSYSHENAAEDEPPVPMESRRKLSVSKSGRMKHAQKKRMSLSIDVFGDDHLQTIEKPKAREYHVHPQTAPVVNSKPNVIYKEREREVPKTLDIPLAPREVRQKKTPEEEEIDMAFEVIQNT